jgi:Ca-activated chloride channel family protein
MGYFRLSIRPKPDRESTPLPKDVTFVIDASKSIARRRLDLTVRGVKEAIDGLRPDDMFNIVIFRDYPVEFRPRRVPASREERTAAHAFLSGIEPGGETDIFKALLPVVSQPPRPGVPGIVLVLSDGRPTRGIQDSRGIINALSADNAGNGVFAYAGGRTVNTYLLDMLAYRNRGAAEVTPGIEEIGSGLPAFFRRLDSPILVAPRADFGRIDESQVFPRELPDFFGDRGVVVCGRYDPQRHAEFVMRLTGRAGAREKEVVFRANLREGRPGDRSIAREWANAKAYHLVGEISRRGEQPALLEALRELGRVYGVRTPYNE